MVNRHRGEIEAILDGKSYRLCLTLGALAELEHEFGEDDMLAVAERFGEGRGTRENETLENVQSDRVSAAELPIVMRHTQAQQIAESASPMRWPNGRWATRPSSPSSARFRRIGP
jgi:hypothetical protein